MIINRRLFFDIIRDDVKKKINIFMKSTKDSKIELFKSNVFSSLKIIARKKNQ